MSRPLALVALLVFAAAPTASADVVDEAPAVPECWLHSEQVGPSLALAYACLIPCPDHTCTSYPWNRDPTYYLPDLTDATPSAVGDAEPPECWFSSRSHDVGPYVTIHDTCIILCPDHTCHSYPWNKDPWYYLEDVVAA